MTAAMMLPVYLLVLAGFLMLVNIKAAETWIKFLSVVSMLAALIGSAVTAFAVYR